MKHEVNDSINLRSGHVGMRSVAVLVCLTGITTVGSNAPANQWSNPVLATAEAVLGPLTEAAKLVSGILTDYCKLNAYTTIQYYKSTEISTRGTAPIQEYQETVIESGVDPKTGSKNIDRTVITNIDRYGKVTKRVSNTDVLISRIGNLHTTCIKLNPDGSLLGKYEYIVDPTLINIHVDIAKYATYSSRNPKQVYVEMSGTADVLTDCNEKNRETAWYQVARVSPGVLNVVPFSGKKGAYENSVAAY